MASFTHKICTANRMRQLDVSNGSERMQHFLLVRSSFIPANNKRWQRLQSSRCRILPMHRETHESGWLVWALLLLTKVPHSEGSAIWRLWCRVVCSAFMKESSGHDTRFCVDSVDDDKIAHFMGYSSELRLHQLMLLVGEVVEYRRIHTVSWKVSEKNHWVRFSIGSFKLLNRPNDQAEPMQPWSNKTWELRVYHRNWTKSMLH